MSDRLPENRVKQKLTWKSNKLPKLAAPLTLFNEKDEDDFHFDAKPKEHKKQSTLTANNANLKKQERSKQLKLEGSCLAEDGQLEDALSKWHEASSLNPNDETLYEMSCQVLMMLEKDYLAIQRAEKAVDINRKWWIGWQTLGRAQINFGDTEMALKSFSRALHLCPWNRELRETDFQNLLLARRGTKLEE